MDTMRIRKHRAWHKESKVMLYDSSVNIFKWEEEQQPVEVMDWTGLKDKNGKEIYEGDIFMLSEGHPHWISKKMEIVFFRGSFCIKVIGVDYLIKTPTSFLNYFDACEDYGLVEPFERFIKVIGNIHQSPELLNQK